VEADNQFLFNILNVISGQGLGLRVEVISVSISGGEKAKIKNNVAVTSFSVGGGCV
jgi:hypothetical protein